MKESIYQKNLRKRLATRQKENHALRRAVMAGLRDLASELPKTFPDVTRMVLTGSFAGKGYSCRSDVDIVITGLKKADYFRFYNVLESRLKRNIDLIMDEDLTDVGRRHILKNMEVIYDREKARRRGA